MVLSKCHVIRYTHTLTGYTGFLSADKKVKQFESPEDAEAHLAVEMAEGRLPHHGAPMAIAYEIAEVRMLRRPGKPQQDDPEPEVGPASTANQGRTKETVTRRKPAKSVAK